MRFLGTPRRKMSTSYMDLPIGIRIIQKISNKFGPTLQATRVNRYRFSVLFLTYICYLCYHLTRKPISVVKPVLHRNCSELELPPNLKFAPNESTWCDYPPFDGPDSTALLGYLDSAFLFSYGSAMFISGLVAERVSLRYFLTFGMLLSAIFTYLFGLAKSNGWHSIWYFVVVQALAGICQTTGWPGVVTVVTRWYGKTKRGFIFGVWNSHMSIGNILGSLIAAYYVETDWALSFIVPAIIMGVVGILLFLFLVDAPEIVGCQERPERKASYKSIECGISNSNGSSDVDDTDIIVGDQIDVLNPHKLTNEHSLGDDDDDDNDENDVNNMISSNDHTQLPVNLSINDPSAITSDNVVVVVIPKQENHVNNDDDDDDVDDNNKYNHDDNDHIDQMHLKQNGKAAAAAAVNMENETINFNVTNKHEINAQNGFHNKTDHSNNDQIQLYKNGGTNHSTEIKQNGDANDIVDNNLNHHLQQHQSNTNKVNGDIRKMANGNANNHIIIKPSMSTPLPSSTVPPSSDRPNENQDQTVKTIDQTDKQQEINYRPTEHTPMLDHHNHRNGADNLSTKSAIGFVGALKIPGVIEFSLCLFFSKLVSYTFLYWLPLYIQSSTTMSATKSADLSTLFDIGGIVGAITAGVLSDYTGMPACTCSVMLIWAVPMLLVYQTYGATSIVLNVLLLFVCGVLVNGPYALITTSVSAELGTHSSLEGNAKALATVTAIIDGTGSIGAAVGPLLAGLVSSSGWQNVFYMLMASDIVALVLLIRLVGKEIARFKRNPRID